MKLKNILERQCEELRDRIKIEEKRLAAMAPDRKGERLQYAAKKNGFYLYIGSKRSGFRKIRSGDRDAMARANNIQDRRYQEELLRTLKNNLNVAETAAGRLQEQDALSVLKRLPAAYSMTPWNRMDPAYMTCGTTINGNTSGTLMQKNMSVIQTRGNVGSTIAAPYTGPLSDSEWVAMNTEQNPKHPEKKDVDTSFGLKVRSKSEGWIAEFLYRNGHAFRYEPRLVLITESGPAEFYPDFEIRTSPDTSVILEHLGWMDDTSYAERSYRKLDIYIDNGFMPGRNLFITTETLAHPFDSKDAEDLVSMLEGIMEVPA